MDGKRTEFLKGCTETLVLHLLAERAMYGYELIRELRERSGGAFDLGQGTVYPLLYTLERRGLVKGRWQQSDDTSRARKYYGLTRRGAAAASARIGEWGALVVAMARVLEAPRAAVR